MTQETKFPTSKPRRRSSLKRQRMAVLVILLVVAILGTTFGIVYRFTSRITVEYPDGSNVVDADGTKYYAVLRDNAWVMINKKGDLCERTSDGLYKTADGTLVSIDGETGEPRVVATVLLNGTEQKYFDAGSGSYDILLYPMLEREDIRSIHVHNKQDDFTFVRQSDGAFRISGFEITPFDSVMFSTLVVVTGYTNTIARLDLSPQNPHAEGFRQNGYAEYGLPDDPEQAAQYFVITATDGTTHKVLIGNPTVDGLGYYARYYGRDDVYILKQMTKSDYNSTLSGTLLCTLEDFVTPTVSDTMGSSNYFDVINYTMKTVSGGVTENRIQFSYEPIEKRKDTFYASTPYVGEGVLKGYAINDYQVDVSLQALMDMTPKRTVKLYRTNDLVANMEDFAKEKGIAFEITYTFVGGNRKGAEGNYEPIFDEKTTDQRILISPLTRNEAGEEVYYMYSPLFNMIVETERTYMAFLEWDAYDWISPNVVSEDINYLEKLEISLKNGTTYYLPGANGESKEDDIAVSGIQNIVFDVDYVNAKGEKTDSTADDAEIRVFATYGDQVNVVLSDTFKFRRFYQTLLASSLEGEMPSGSEAWQEELRNHYTPDVTITLTFRVDGKPQTRTIRFYSGQASSGRGAYVTMDNVGIFYMLQNRVDKIISDAGKAITAAPGYDIDYEAKK